MIVVFHQFFLCHTISQHLPLSISAVGWVSLFQKCSWAQLLVGEKFIGPKLCWPKLSHFLSLAIVVFEDGFFIITENSLTNSSLCSSSSKSPLHPAPCPIPQNAWHNLLPKFLLPQIWIFSTLLESLLLHSRCRLSPVPHFLCSQISQILGCWYLG